MDYLTGAWLALMVASIAAVIASVVSKAIDRADVKAAKKRALRFDVDEMMDYRQQSDPQELPEDVVDV